LTPITTTTAAAITEAARRELNKFFAAGSAMFDVGYFPPNTPPDAGYVHFEDRPKHPHGPHKPRVSFYFAFMNSRGEFMD
jgi:hypothetical protein